MSKYTITNIEWDTDGNKALANTLPKELEINVPSDVEAEGDEAINEYLSDEVSNETGYCHFGFASTLK